MLVHADGMVSGEPPYGGMAMERISRARRVCCSLWCHHGPEIWAVLRSRDNCSVARANHPRESCTRHADEAILVVLLIPDRLSPAHQPILAATIKPLHNGVLSLQKAGNKYPW